MTTKNHNETFAGIQLVIGGFFAIGLVVSPWVIGHREQIRTMVKISVILLPLALLMFTTAFAMHRQKPLARKLALWSGCLAYDLLACSNLQLVVEA